MRLHVSQLLRRYPSPFRYFAKLGTCSEISDQIANRFVRIRWTCTFLRGRSPQMKSHLCCVFLSVFCAAQRSGAGSRNSIVNRRNSTGEEVTTLSESYRYLLAEKRCRSWTTLNVAQAPLAAKEAVTRCRMQSKSCLIPSCGRFCKILSKCWTSAWTFR